MFGVAMLFVYVFVCPFSNLITLLGEEGAGPLICVTFSLPPGVGRLCGLCLWLFSEFSIYLFAC